jgi:uncharacterized protein YlzI (FlbEa/FlbD family)
MIQLTRLNSTTFAVNCDLIKYVEESPDTVITLLNGEKLVVRETAEQVIGRVREFRRSVVMPATDASVSGDKQELAALNSTLSASTNPGETTRG